MKKSHSQSIHTELFTFILFYLISTCWLQTSMCSFSSYRKTQNKVEYSKWHHDLLAWRTRQELPSCMQTVFLSSNPTMINFTEPITMCPACHSIFHNHTFCQECKYLWPTYMPELIEGGIWGLKISHIILKADEIRFRPVTQYCTIMYFARYV